MTGLRFPPIRRPASRGTAGLALGPALTLALTLALASTLGLGGCQAPDLATSLRAPGPAPSDPTALHAYAEDLGHRYDAHPDDKAVGLAYARALKGLTQYAQAAAVLQKIAVKRPHDLEVLAAYGKALADAGHLEEAAAVLERSHTPERPSWSVLSAQGSVADQLGDHGQAQSYYAAALKIAPNQPQVLSNLGLSYALERQMPDAERTLRTAAAQPGADMRVRQNLALVLALQGKFAEAEDVSRRDLAPIDAAANVAAIRQTIAQSDVWHGGKPVSARRAVALQPQPRLADGSTDGTDAASR